MAKSKIIEKVKKVLPIKEKKLSAQRKSKIQKKKPNIIEFNPNQQNTKVNSADKNAKRPKKGERNYYQNFDFFFKRTCFRTMTLFFKLAYKPFFD